MENLVQGLEVVGVGIGGVFLNLLLLMLLVQGIGKVFGKKKKKKPKKDKADETEEATKAEKAETQENG